MRRMKKFLMVAAALVAAVAMLPSPTAAQGFQVNGIQVAPFRAVSNSDVITAVHTVPALYIKYVGSSAGTATVAVAAGGDMTLQVAGANDTTVNPAAGLFAAACGATPGVLDLSTPAGTCNTLGKVVDVINGSANWVAVLGSALRADTSDNALKDFVAASAKLETGLPIYQETTSGLTATLDLSAFSTRGIRNWLPNSNGKLPANPFADFNTVLQYASENVTTTDNAANLINVYCVTEANNKGGVSSESVRTMYFEALAATTTTGKVDEFLNAGGLVCNGGKLLVRVNGNTTLTAPALLATGYVQTKQ